MAGILHVEDDPNDAFLLQHAFRQADMAEPLYLARNGQEAVDYLAGAGEFSDRIRFPLPQLIILDLNSPIKSGLEVLRWLRQESGLPWLPVIICTASGRVADIDKAYRLGANAFVVKPASVAKRKEFALHLKGFWLELNELPGEPSPHADSEHQIVSIF